VSVFRLKQFLYNKSCYREFDVDIKLFYADGTSSVERITVNETEETLIRKFEGLAIVG